MFDRCVRSLQGNADFRVARRRLADYFWPDVAAKDVDAVHLRDALMQRDRIGLYRRLVTTTRGYVGIVPEDVEAGDAVVVLQGCSVLLVLREDKSAAGGARWRVVGECYVHGIMNGEA